MNRHILLTGATGAMGPQLAARLAAGGAAERIAVLLRPATAGAAPPNARFDRWRGVVGSILSPSTAALSADALYPVCGDIRHDDLGLDGAADMLRRETDIIIHAAADTNFSAPADRQWDVNVEGTRRLLDWARGCPRLKAFVLVSSTFVAGSRTGAIDETALDHPPGFVTHYQRTKWEAERLALASGLPVRIARLSLAMGSHATGHVYRAGALHSMIRWFGRGLIPVLPGRPHASADLIATETAAHCLTRAVLTEVPPGPAPIWHIAAGDRAPSLAEVATFVYEQFARSAAWRRRRIPPARIVDQDEFDRTLQSIDAAGHPSLGQALGSINLFLPDLLYPKRYVTSRAQAMWGGPLPLPDWRETLARVIQFCCPETRDIRPG